MKDVVRRGTAARAGQALKRSDLAGKTGTTNDYVDAWFCGYQPSLVGVAWIGFDQPKRLGNGETGGSAALPIWIGYMAKALKDVPEMPRATACRHGARRKPRSRQRVRPSTTPSIANRFLIRSRRQKRHRRPPPRGRNLRRCRMPS